MTAGDGPRRRLLSDDSEPSALRAVRIDKSIAARGRLDSLATCIDLCARLGFLKQAEVARLIASNSVGRLLNGLYRSLEAKLLQESNRGASATPNP